MQVIYNYKTGKDSIKSLGSHKSGKCNHSLNLLDSGIIDKNPNVIDYNSLDKIDEATFQKLQGKFYDLIISSHASKGLQNALKSTLSSIISKIFEEVTVSSKL